MLKNLFSYRLSNRGANSLSNLSSLKSGNGRRIVETFHAVEGDLIGFLRSSRAYNFAPKVFLP